MRAGEAGGGVGGSEGEAGGGVGEDAVADVGDSVGGVVAIERESVRGVEAAGGGEVVEGLECAGDDDFVAIGGEVAAVAGVVEHGTEGVAASGAEIDDGGFGTGALEGAVGAAVEFGTCEGDGGDGAVVEVAADVCGGDSVDEDFIGVRCATTNVKSDGTAGLAGLNDVCAWGLAEIVGDADLRGEGGLRDEGDAGRDLLDWRGNAARDNGSLRCDGGELHDDVAGDDGGAAAIEVLANAGGVGRGGGKENEAASGGAADLVGAVHLGHGEGGDSFALDEFHARVADGDAKGSGDGASDDDGVGWLG